MTDQLQEKRGLTRRRKYLVDDVQTALLKHMMLSWLAVFGVIASVLLAVESYKGDFALGFYECLAAMWRHNAALVVALSILAPMMAYDSVRISHRFAGPMVSFRRTLKNLGNGERVDPIRFRENDFWQDIAESFNLVVERIDRLETAKCDDQSEPITLDV